MARNILFSLFLTLLIAFSNAKSLELETAELIEKLQIENQFLRNQLRDVESDIVEIQKILKGHGNDITDIRIVQGAHTEVLEEHETRLDSVDGTLLVNEGQLQSHDQLFIEQHESIEVNKNQIAAHDLTLASHEALVQANIAAIASNLELINSNGLRIDANVNSIGANVLSIQAVTDSYNLFRANQVGFYGETRFGNGEERWPQNTQITFEQNIILNTHNAMNGAQFTTPVAGVYAFTFTADFHLYDDQSDSGYIEVRVNQGIARSYEFDSTNDNDLWQSFSVDFTFALNVGDYVWITTAGDPIFDISRTPATWQGYLVHPF